MKGATSTLPIFCVSNTEYDKYLSGYRIEDPPRLSLHTTGIPALRNYIYALPAKGHFATLEHHLTTNWETLLNSLEMFCNASTTQRKGEVTGNCTQSRTVCSNKISHKLF